MENENTPKRGIYLLPNLFTTAGLFAGFYAIVAAMKSDFEISAIALFIAMIFDSLDGRVARLTNTQSAFGAQYDSISDMLCFGVTPALVVYSWGLQYLGKLGWLAAFFYAAATALRLARFNTQLDLADNRFFTGLPCPVAAAVIAGMVWVGIDFAIPGKRISEIAAIVTIGIGFLMVSNFRYPSFKEIDFKENVPFVAVLLVVIVYLLIAWDPPKVLFGISFIYALSGIIWWAKEFIWQQIKGRDKPADSHRHNTSTSTSSSDPDSGSNSSPKSSHNSSSVVVRLKK